jgi:hypothetical protein
MRPGREADLSPPASAEVNPLHQQSVSAEAVKHWDDATRHFRRSTLVQLGLL